MLQVLQDETVLPQCKVVQVLLEQLVYSALVVQQGQLEKWVALVIQVLLGLQVLLGH